MMEDWRKRLCRCGQCETRYIAENLHFLLDQEDALKSYEAKGKRKLINDSFAAGSRAFEQKLTHSQKIEMAMGYREMSTKFTEYFRDFAESDKVVTKDDIQSFFETLSSKRRKRNTDN